MLSSGDVENLERRRFKYKLKNFFKIFIPLIVLSATAISAFFIFPNLKKIKDIRLSLIQNKEIPKEKIEKKKVVIVKKVEKSEIKPKIKPEVKTKKEETQKEKVIKRILIKKEIPKKKKIIRTNKIENANAITSKKEIKNRIELHKKFLNIENSQIKNSKVEKKKKKAIINIDSKVVIKHQKPIKSNFVKSGNEINYEGKNISYLKKRFRNTNRFRYSIAIAEEYYKKGEYKKSIKWSLISNDLNSKDARSWVFFAKSKVKMGQRNEAVDALNMFLKTHKSRSAENLMSRIKHGAL